jgi:hypothetical protein
MELRCEAHGVAVVKLPTADRLEAPQDELTKKLRHIQSSIVVVLPFFTNLPSLMLSVLDGEARGLLPGPPFH